jgi:hypothetical protein
MSRVADDVGGAGVLVDAITLCVIAPDVLVAEIALCANDVVSVDAVTTRARTVGSTMPSESTSSHIAPLPLRAASCNSVSPLRAQQQHEHHTHTRAHTAIT